MLKKNVEKEGQKGRNRGKKAGKESKGNKVSKEFKEFKEEFSEKAEKGEKEVVDERKERMAEAMENVRGEMEERRKREQKKLKNLMDTIRRTLQNAGKYKSEMSRQVELTASTIMIYRLVRDAILENEEWPVVEELSREGAMRKKENPIFSTYGKFADMLRRDLRALDMNKELTKGKDDAVGGEDDELGKLLSGL